MRRVRLVLWLVIALVPMSSVAEARRRPPPDDRLEEMELVGPDERRVGPGAGAPVMIRPPHPPPVVTQAQLRATLFRARPDLQACLPTAGTWRSTVRATLSARRGLTLAVSLAPRDPAIRACLDTAARRWLVPLEGQRLAGTITASVQVRSTGTTPPPPPINPPPPSNAYDEGLVHARLDAQRNEVLRCLPAASTSTPGDITLRLSVRPDGSMVLEGATLPSGVGGGPVLGCLSGVIGRVRVPAPPTTRAVTHVVTLGR